MDDSSNNPELESFRQQWRAEVSARSKAGEPSHRRQKSTQQQQQQQQLPSKPSARRPSIVPKAPPKPSDDGSDNELSDKESGVPAAPFTLPSSSLAAAEKDAGKLATPHEPESALEHYEKAVEREAQGNLGDSLKLYRKAFRVRPSISHDSIEMISDNPHS